VRGTRTFRVDRIEAATELAGEPAARPPDFDLEAYWEAWARDFEGSLPLLAVRVRVQAHGWDALRRGADIRARDDLPPAPPTAAATHEVDVRYESLEIAEIELRKLGADVEALGPPTLRRRLRDTARALADLYADAL
jgi:predicted DNA-binding transcriptional regulator YafY